MRHTVVGEDPINHPYRVQCSCGEWCYDFHAHVARVPFREQYPTWRDRLLWWKRAASRG